MIDLTNFANVDAVLVAGTWLTLQGSRTVQACRFYGGIQGPAVTATHRSGTTVIVPLAAISGYRVAQINGYLPPSHGVNTEPVGWESAALGGGTPGRGPSPFPANTRAS